MRRNLTTLRIRLPVFRSWESNSIWMTLERATRISSALSVCRSMWSSSTVRWLFWQGKMQNPAIWLEAFPIFSRIRTMRFCLRVWRTKKTRISASRWMHCICRATSIPSRYRSRNWHASWGGRCRIHPACKNPSAHLGGTEEESRDRLRTEW